VHAGIPVYARRMSTLPLSERYALPCVQQSTLQV